MFRKLVVPLDGSELAERALPYAVRLARAGQGQLSLVRVAAAPPSMSVDGVDWAYYLRQAIADAEQYLGAIAAELRDRVPVETTVLPHESPALQILDHARQIDADGIVMATHGRTGLAHLLYGSVPEMVLAKSTVPVFLVHARPGQLVQPAFDPLAVRVVVPLDGSVFAEAALDLAADLVGPAGELVLVTVVQPPDHVLRDDRGRPLAFLDQQAEARTYTAQAYLEPIAHRLREEHHDLHVSVEVRMDAAADAGIIAATVARDAELVIMATHGRTGLSRVTMGSVAGDVLRNGNTPLLLVRPVMQAHQPASRRELIAV